MLTNGRLIDGNGGTPVDDAVVVVTAGQIVGVGARDSTNVPADLEAVDLHRATIVPGLVNAHVHEVFDEDVLREFASGGVTTVCDLQYNRSGATVQEIIAARDALSGPGAARLAAAGKFINVTGGYPNLFFDLEIINVDTTDEAVRAVEELADAGANVIKTVFESGTLFGQSGWPILPAEVAAAIVDTAHSRGLPVIAHVTNIADVDAAIAAGADGMAHLPTGTYTDELVSQIAESGMFVIPTLELYSTVLGQVGMNEMIGNLASLHDAGVRVVLGTDYDGNPSAPNFFEIGAPMKEIGFMAAAGMSPMDVIVAGTRNAAEACNVDTLTGTVEIGKDADLLIVSGDPLSDLAALAEPAMVLVRGEPAFSSLAPGK